ncbi:MAG: efflux RND transporter periplasmic adaptor subunit [Pseudomonadota bacterium]
MEKQQKDQEKPSLIWRAGRLIVRLTLTTAIIAGAAFAVQFGASELAQRANAAPTPDAASAIPVVTYPLRIEDGYDVQRAFVGQVEPQKTVAVSFELPGQLSEILVDEGDTVTKGQVLARQDTALLKAEREQLLASKAATEAQLKLANQTLDRNERLRKSGFASQAGFDSAVARRDELLGRRAEIAAGLRNVDIRLSKSQIQAPFDGRVTTRSVDGGETLGAGQSFLNLVETRAPIVRVGVPLDFDETALSQVQISLSGQEYPAQLITLRPDVDPVTRTRTAIFEIEPDARAAFGQIARLQVQERVAVDGFWVPLTSLKEGVRGQWTLLAVDQGDTVRTATVEILHAESDRVFVRGAFPTGARLIEEGPQRVTVGQRVVVNVSE